MTGPAHATHAARIGTVTLDGSPLRREPEYRFRAVVGGVIAVLILASGLVACSTDSEAGQRENACIAAFRNVDPRALPPYGASPLDDAVRRCRSVADWRAAWDAVPAAHQGTTDPLTYLAGRCALESLATTSICRELASAS